MDIILSKSNRKGKKYMVKVNGKTIHFGAQGYEDYTTHKDPKRKASYIARHKARENWGKSGITTSGYWAYHLLWGEPTLTASIKKLEQKHNINIINKT